MCAIATDENDEVQRRVSGTVARIDGCTETNIPIVTIEAFDGTQSRILYVDLNASTKKGLRL